MPTVSHYLRNGHRNSGFLKWFRNPEIQVRNSGNLGFMVRNSGNHRIRIRISGSHSVRARNSGTHTIKTRNSRTHTSRSRKSYMHDIPVWLVRFYSKFCRLLHFRAVWPECTLLSNQEQEFPESDVADLRNSYFAASWFRNFRHLETDSGIYDIG